MIDFHSHTLPFADHGCEDATMAERQHRRARAAGIDVLCVTPHFYPHIHTLDSFLHKRNVGIRALSPAPEGLRLIHGAEVLLCEGIDTMEGLEALCLEGTRTLLLELPDRQFDATLANTVKRIERRGIVPVLAHIERYPSQTRASAMEVCPRVQMNYSGIAGLLRRSFARKLADEEVLCAIGSDTHGEDNTYRLLPQVKKALGSLLPEIEGRTRTLLGID